MLILHLVLVILHEQFTICIWSNGKRSNLWSKTNTIGDTRVEASITNQLSDIAPIT